MSTRAKDLLRRELERVPSLYVALAKRRPGAGPRRPLVDRRIDLVIEGFPRSGNSYLLSWLEVSNPGLRIASHGHSMAHVQLAVKMGIPTVVLLREPLAAIASEVVRRGLDVETDPGTFVNRYERFYASAAELAPHVLLSTFEVTTGRTSEIVDALGDRTSLPVDRTPPDPADVTAHVEQLNRTYGGASELTVARPSPQRKELTAKVRTHLEQHHHEAMARLKALHDEIAAQPTTLR